MNRSGRVCAPCSPSCTASPTPISSIPIEYPPNRTLGDLGTPVAFDLARRLRKAPRVIAQELAGALGPIPGVSRVEAAPNGYLNVFLDRPAFLLSRLGLAGALPAPPAHTEKTIVEHTAINPNKAAHIGHLRNSALGDTLVRVLAFRGNPVEVQNYIDDTGVQVADVVVGFRELEQRRPRRRAAHRATDAVRLLLLGSLRARHRVVRGRQGTAEDPRRDAARHRARRRADRRASPRSSPTRSSARHLKTMARLNIDYQLLTWEGDILRLQFWARAFEVLKQTGAVYPADRGTARRLLGDEDRRCRRRRRRGRRSDRARTPRGRARKSSCARTAPSSTSARTWPTSSGSPACSASDFLYRQFATRIDGDAAVGDDQRPVAGGRRSPAVRRRGRDLQRDRRAPVVSAEAAEAGAVGDRPSAGSRAADPLLVRDGGAVARHRDASSASRRLRIRRTPRGRSSRCRAARAWA